MDIVPAQFYVFKPILTYVVMLTIEGKQFQFEVDTEASLSLVSEETKSFGRIYHNRYYSKP